MDRDRRTVADSRIFAEATDRDTVLLRESVRGSAFVGVDCYAHGASGRRRPGDAPLRSIPW